MITVDSHVTYIASVPRGTTVLCAAQGNRVYFPVLQLLLLRLWKFAPGQQTHQTWLRHATLNVPPPWIVKGLRANTVKIRLFSKLDCAALSTATISQVGKRHCSDLIISKPQND